MKKIKMITALSMVLIAVMVSFAFKASTVKKAAVVVDQTWVFQGTSTTDDENDPLLYVLEDAEHPVNCEGNTIVCKISAPDANLDGYPDIPSQGVRDANMVLSEKN